MTRLRRAALCLLVFLTGCADGGPVGTGISASAISGNVIAVDTTSSGSGAAGAPGVRVSIDQSPGLEAVTDSDGNFALSGDFAGEVTVRFRTSDVTATAAVDVPDNANVVLQDIVVSPGKVRFAAARVVGFLGQLAMVDCADGTLLVNDRHQTSHQFLVRLSSDTVLLQGDGKSVACAALTAGTTVVVEGAMRFVDKTIDAFTVTVDPLPQGTQPLVTEVRFHGVVAVLNCAGGMLMLDDPVVGRTRLRLDAQTRIADPSGAPLACDVIRVGDRADGDGTINVRRPEVIEAVDLVIRPLR